MEQMPHHREGIQKQLDKAYDEAHRDNKMFDEAQAKIADIKGEKITEEVSPELVETITRLKDAGYLDTSFEGKEFHRLRMRPLSEDEMRENYKVDGNRFLHPDMKMSDLYRKQKEETLNVMIMNFSESDDWEDGIGSRDVIGIMNNLGVRPITYAELLQFCITNKANKVYLDPDTPPKRFVALGSLGDSQFTDYASVAQAFAGNVYTICTQKFGIDWNEKLDVFPVVRK